MTTTPTLRVDTATLLETADRHGWSSLCVQTLAEINGTAHLREMVGDAALANGLPEQIDFAEVRQRTFGAHLLDAIESLADVDHTRLGGYILLGIARNILEPLVPADHPAKAATGHLLQSLVDYLHHGARAERSIGDAFRFRSAFGSTYSAIGADAEYESLFEAMPSGGLDCPMGEGSWHLADHWQSFGRFLASRRDDWKLIGDIDRDLDETELVAGDFVANNLAADAVRENILDRYREVFVDLALEEYEEALASVVDSVLPVAVGASPVRG